MSKKTEIVLKKTGSVLVTVEPPNAEMDLGKQIDYFQEIVKQSASIGCTAAVINGVLLVKAQIQHPKTFQDWLAANTSISQSCSYNYINAAKRTMGTQIVEELAQRGTMEIAEKVQQAMVKLRLESKPLTELYCDVGIVKRTPSNMGGRREGAGRKRKDSAEELAKQAEDIANALTAEATRDSVAKLYNLGIVQGGFGEMNDTDLKDAIDALESVLQKAKEILKSRASNTRTRRA